MSRLLLTFLFTFLVACTSVQQTTSPPVQQEPLTSQSIPLPSSPAVQPKPTEEPPKQINELLVRASERHAQLDELLKKSDEQFESDRNLTYSTYDSLSASLMAECKQETGDIQEVCFDKALTLIDITHLVTTRQLALWSLLNKDLIYYGYNSQVDLQDIYQNASSELARDMDEGIQKIKRASSFRKSSVEPSECKFNTYNCADFSTQAQAQAIFNACPTDVHYLDGDSDGVACETLPRTP